MLPLMHKGRVESLPVFDGVDAYYPLSAPYFRALFEHILYIGGRKALSVKIQETLLAYRRLRFTLRTKKNSSNGL